MSALGPPVDVATDYAVRRMEHRDLEAVVNIERLGASNPWPLDAFVHELEANALSHPLVAVASAEAEEIAGFCVFWVVQDEMSVQNLGVHPSHRRRGLGRRLVSIAMAEALFRGARVALLEVRRSNDPARRLYSELGFEPCGERRDYYARPREDAVLYRKLLWLGPP